MNDELIIVGPDIALRGGAQQHLSNILVIFGGRRVHLACFGTSQSTGSGWEAESFVAIGHRSWRDYPRSAQRLSSLFRKINPACVLAFGIQPLLAATLAAKLSGLRVNIAYFEITRPHAELSQVKFVPRRAVLKVMMRYAIQRSRIVAVNSLSGWDELHSYFGVPTSRLRVLRNIFIASECVRLPYEKNKHFRVTAVCRLVSSKGVEDVISACVLASRTASLELMIVGDGVERRNLEDFSRKVGGLEIVRFVGWTESALDELAKSDLFVCSSDYEGYPNSLVEAMAVGVPVITTPWGVDAVDLIERRVVCGYPRGDPVVLSQLILQLVTQPQLCLDLAEKGKKEADDRFSKPVATAAYTAFFNELTGLAKTATRRESGSLLANWKNPG